MAQVPASIAEFLKGKRIAVAGVSRGGTSAANPVFKKLRDTGYEVFPVNPKTTEIEGTRCYPDLATIPADLDGVVVATHPACRPTSCDRPRSGRGFGSGSTGRSGKAASRQRRCRNASACRFRASSADAR